MDKATFTKESSLNRSHCRERIQREFAGKYVALVYGKIIGAATTFDKARGMVALVQPVPEYFLVFPAEIEPDFDFVSDFAENTNVSSVT